MRWRAAVFAATLVCPHLASAQDAETVTGRWQSSCSTDATGQIARCEVLQSVQNSLGEVILQLAFGAPAADGQREVVLQVPQGTQLAVPVTLAAQDGRVLLVAPYFTCINRHCFAGSAVGAATVAALAERDVVIAGFTDRSGRQISVALPFGGLMAALNGLPQ